jgi:hypothetical protein
MKPSEIADAALHNYGDSYANFHYQLVSNRDIAALACAYLRLREAAQAIFDSAIEVYGDLDTDADSGIYARDILAALGPALEETDDQE